MKNKMLIKSASYNNIVVADNRKEESVHGSYIATRGNLEEAGSFTIVCSSGGVPGYISSYAGDDCGLTITSFRSGNKILLKVTADSSDINTTKFKCEFNSILK